MDANTSPPNYAARERSTPKAIDSACVQDARRPRRPRRTYVLLDAKVLFLTAKFVRFSLVALLSAAVYSIAVAVRPHRYVLSSAKESPQYKAHFVFARMPQAVSLGNVGTASRSFRTAASIRRSTNATRPHPVSERHNDRGP